MQCDRQIYQLVSVPFIYELVYDPKGDKGNIYGPFQFRKNEVGPKLPLYFVLNEKHFYLLFCECQFSTEIFFTEPMRSVQIFPRVFGALVVNGYSSSLATGAPPTKPSSKNLLATHIRFVGPLLWHLPLLTICRATCFRGSVGNNSCKHLQIGGSFKFCVGRIPLLTNQRLLFLFAFLPRRTSKRALPILHLALPPGMIHRQSWNLASM